MRLCVYLYDRLIGHIITDSRYGFTFEYADDAPYPISISLPLEERIFRGRRAEAFFSGLLPDGNIREKLARNAHVSPQSTVSLLASYGSDIAGAVVILEEGEAYVPNSSGYREVSEEEIAARIEHMEEESLLLWGNNVRLSLAGAQEKVPLFFEDGKWFVPEGNSPSNCIIKPGNDLAINEFVCTKLAEFVGLDVPEVSMYFFAAERAVVSKRYDRMKIGGRTVRLQQEDMCQALGIAPEKKYENEGGPGIRQIYKLIETNSSLPVRDLEDFLRCVIFNFLIGNCDAHGKNFSFLYGYNEKNTPRLAPFYDIMSTTVYPGLSRSLAMKIGNERRIDRVVREDFFSIGLVSKQCLSSLIDKTVRDFSAALEHFLNDPEFSPYHAFLGRLSADAASRIERLTAAG